MILDYSEVIMIYGQSVENPSPVLSLIIVDGQTLDLGRINDDTKILLVVRDKETNITHPNVISVPTQRIPHALYGDILQSATVINNTDLRTYYAGNYVSNMTTNGHHPLVYAVESLLALKLNLADAVETDGCKFECRLCISQEGKAYHSNLPVRDGREEYISMVSLLVSVREGIDLIPPNSASYSHIMWIKVKTFLETVKSRNPLVVDLNPLEYCIRGLCIITAYEVIARELGG